MTSATAVGSCSVESVDATGGIFHLNEVKERISKGWERQNGAALSENLNSSNDWSYDNGIGIWEGE